MLRPFLEFNKTITRREIRTFSEMLALTDEYNKAFYVASVAEEFLLLEVKKEIDIKAFTNNNLLFETLKSTKSVLHFEISALRKMCQKENC